MRRINVLKKLIAFLLVMVLVANVQCANANASDKKEDGLIAYVESMLPQYLTVNELLASEYRVSEPINLYDWETGESEKTFFLVFEGNCVVGQMVVQCYEGEYYSSFNTSYLDVLTKVYREKTPVAFGAYNGCFVMRTETENLLLSATNKENPLSGLSENTNRKALCSSCLLPITIDDSIEVSPAISSRMVVYNKQLDVDWVANSIMNYEGICWAACVAAKVNYQSETDLRARDVYNSLLDEYNEIPVGNDYWIERAYLEYDVDITMLQNSISAGACLTQLINERPIHISILGVDEEEESVAHSVLITGIQYTDVSGTAGIYTLMDPNISSPVSLGVSPSVIQNGSGFNYVVTYEGGQIIYSSWTKTRY